MAAPENTVWGSIVNDYCRIGISTTTDTTDTEVTVSVGVWFWSKYSVSDSDGNYLYLDALSIAGSASTYKGDTSIYTTNDSGSGWSTSNQVLLTGTNHTYKFNREALASTKYICATLTGVNTANYENMYVETALSIPALNYYYLDVNGAHNGDWTTVYGQFDLYINGVYVETNSDHWVQYPYGTTYELRNIHGINGYRYLDGTNLSGTITDDTAVSLTFELKPTYTITYSKGSYGTGNDIPAGKQIQGESFTLTSAVYSRTGYTQTGWSTSDGGEFVYGIGQSFSAGIGFGSDCTLYPYWTINTYTNKIMHWRYVGTGGNNTAGDQYRDENEDTIFVAKYGETVTIPTDLIKSYPGYSNTGIANSNNWIEKYGEWVQKNIGDTFIQPAHNVTIEYYYYPDDSGGTVGIYNGTTFDNYKAYIHNGEKFEAYVPYIYNGTSWDKY